MKRVAHVPSVRRVSEAPRAANGHVAIRSTMEDAAASVSGLDTAEGRLHDAPLEASLEARRRASQVLRTLLAESALLESRLADTGRLDPIRAVSGRSAMDRAIETTRSMIGSVDRLLRSQMLNGGR